MSSRARSGLAILTIAVLSAVYAHGALTALERRLEDPERAEKMLTGDSKHYIAMAEGFSEGRYFDGYVTVSPHRQPLYPALLALMIRARGGDSARLATVNILVVLATIWTLYFLGRWIFRDPAVGVAAALAYATNHFIRSNAKNELLTEPTFVLCCLLAVGLTLAYLQGRRRRILWFASIAAAMAYLARPNGLFLMAGISAAVVVQALQAWLARRKTDRALAASKLRGAALALSVSVGLFALVATPSWIPRVVYWGNPVYHGYLTNYLWVDTYAEGHVRGPPRYGPGHYFETHDLRDVAERMAHGIERVFYTWPLEYSRFHHTLAALGLAAALVARRSWLPGILVMLAVQALPLVWTAQSNVVPRISYAALLPFTVIFIAALAAELRGDGSGEEKPIRTRDVAS